MKDLKNKNIIITGANIGLGYETALHFAGEGATVIMACRNEKKALVAKKKILKKHPKAVLEVMHIDTSKLLSIKHFANSYIKRFKKLDILINNAGIMMSPFKLTEDGFESQLATNYLGHFALTGRLLPLLKNTPQSRVVTLSSLAHKWSPIQLNDLHFKKGYNKQKAYGQSKLACLIFAYELDRRFKANDCETMSVAAHPGLSNTNLAQHMLSFFQWISPLIGQHQQDGAKPTIYAATSELIKGGEYIGPGGFMEWRGKPKPVNSNKASKDKAIAKLLWKISEDMTGVKFDFSIGKV